MSKRNMIFSTQYPAYHPRRGEPTYFVEKIWRAYIDYLGSCFDPRLIDGQRAYDDRSDRQHELISVMSVEAKHHTIRAGNRWKPGDIIMPRVWRLPGGMYTKGNNMIAFAPDIEVKKVWDIKIHTSKEAVSILISDNYIKKEQSATLAKNDGLTESDMYAWFNKSISGQIICWNPNTSYEESPAEFMAGSKEVANG